MRICGFFLNLFLQLHHAFHITFMLRGVQKREMERFSRLFRMTTSETGTKRFDKKTGQKVRMDKAAG